MQNKHHIIIKTFYFKTIHSIVLYLNNDVKPMCFPALIANKIKKGREQIKGYSFQTRWTKTSSQSKMILLE